MPATLNQIEAEIEQLSLADQIELMERLFRIVRHRAILPPITDDDLARMAQNPDIQREIAMINAEFAQTELDGLDS